MNIFGRKDNMKTNMNYFDTDPKHVVTNVMQQRLLHNKRSSLKSLTLFDIISDPEFLAKFNPHEFPKFEIMENGSIFFQPICKVISPIHTHYVKWFSLSRGLAFSNDHDYEFAELNQNGYLMKVVLSRQIDKIESFEVRYLCDVNNVEIVESLSTDTKSAYIDEALKASMPVMRYAVASFNPYQFVSLQSLLVQHPAEFINSYLQDVQEK